MFVEARHSNAESSERKSRGNSSNLKRISKKYSALSFSEIDHLSGIVAAVRKDQNHSCTPLLRKRHGTRALACELGRS
jgi:hypothetical protein